MRLEFKSIKKLDSKLNKMSEIKFSEEELKSLQELSQNYQNIQASFGQMKVQKILNQQQADALEEAEDFSNIWSLLYTIYFFKFDPNFMFTFT